MIRHLIPRFQWQGWYGDALTTNPNAGQQLPDGMQRQLRVFDGFPTTVAEHDDIKGFTITIQWLGLIVEICIGAVR